MVLFPGQVVKMCANMSLKKVVVSMEYQNFGGVEIVNNIGKTNMVQQG